MCDLPPRALRPHKRAAFTRHIRNAIGTCRLAGLWVHQQVGRAFSGRLLQPAIRMNDQEPGGIPGLDRTERDQGFGQLKIENFCPHGWPV